MRHVSRVGIVCIVGVWQVVQARFACEPAAFMPPAAWAEVARARAMSAAEKVFFSMRGLLRRGKGSRAGETPDGFERLS